MRSPEPRLSQADYETLAELRYRLRLFGHFSDEAAEREGLTPQQYQALLTIQGWHEREGVTVGHLAERLLVRPHSAVGLVDRLCALGLVERHHGERDRRQVFLRLTARGADVLESLAATHREQLRRIGPLLRSLLERFGDGREALQPPPDVGKAGG